MKAGVGRVLRSLFLKEKNGTNTHSNTIHWRMHSNTIHWRMPVRTGVTGSLRYCCRVGKDRIRAVLFQWARTLWSMFNP